MKSISQKINGESKEEIEKIKLNIANGLDYWQTDRPILSSFIEFNILQWRRKKLIYILNCGQCLASFS